MRTRRDFDRRGWLAAVALAAGLSLWLSVPAASAEADAVPEPDAYRTDNYRSPVPRTLRGAKSVLATDAAKDLFDAGAVFVDVYPRAPKPANLPATTVWREPPHKSIVGSHWLPNVGYGVIPPATEAYFAGSLERLTGGDKARPVVFFCLRDCWMSWNAAKRAITMGYEAVHWFPDGSDGWEEWGYDVGPVAPVLQ